MLRWLCIVHCATEQILISESVTIAAHCAPHTSNDSREIDCHKALTLCDTNNSQRAQHTPNKNNKIHSIRCVAKGTCNVQLCSGSVGGILGVSDVARVSDCKMLSIQHKHCLLLVVDHKHIINIFIYVVGLFLCQYVSDMWGTSDFIYIFFALVDPVFSHNFLWPTTIVSRPVSNPFCLSRSHTKPSLFCIAARSRMLDTSPPGAIIQFLWTQMRIWWAHIIYIRCSDSHASPNTDVDSWPTTRIWAVTIIGHMQTVSSFFCFNII